MPQQQSLFSFYSKGDALRCNYEPTSFQNNDKADPMKGSYVQLQKQRGKTQWQMLQLREENDKLESLSEKSIGALNSDLMGREMDHVAADYSKSSTLQPFPKAHSFEAKPNDMTKTRKLVSHADKRIQQPIDSIEQSPTEKTRPFNQCYDHVLYQNSGGQKQSSYQDGASELCAPHTPALRPLVPGIRRIRDSEQDILPVESFISDPVKRRKLLNALGTDEVFNQGAWEEARLKFDWLHPTNIRDGDGRKASDPFFDRRTVEVPEKVFNQLSASQKQYWSIKSQYMDTVLFFKVGKFYELYELDAEIGHKELDWKITLSGVGKCRQVGVSESGIDEAVQKLVARGYKVGRMEQIETAAQAKALRGPKATIQRELMQVLTPSTLIDGNLRPEAIHLLALKEELSQGLDGKESCTYGFAFVDAAVGRFYVGSIRDTSSRSALGALLTQVVNKAFYC
ncbi:hypothetical protein O6H91_01G140300 [Diphasiastrum complanatum]|uniref:Uncharacterized protein n=1 Tax=Diphasiastrum complanatum TaxID=34168 RepID=A0ACC2EWT2_DIPCM|nr:hypothetical protein O6H91_01G140300 [Diphasiastrum complanatum]